MYRWSPELSEELCDASGSVQPPSISDAAAGPDRSLDAQSSTDSVEHSSSSSNHTPGPTRSSMVQDGSSQRWLFTSQQMRLSIAQMDIYNAHLTAAEEVDEDFSGSFS